MYLLLTLGEYQRNNPHLAILDWKSKQIIDTYSYHSTSFPKIPSNSFRGGTFYNGLFYVCTFNEVLAVNLETWSVISKLSQPTFNDLHDVFVDEESIWVCSSGLEYVEHYSHDLELIERYEMADHERFGSFDPQIDYRLFEIDKRTIPRQHHVNNVVKVDDDVLVTHGKSECVSTLNRRVLIEDLPGMPHDGFVFKGKFYLTIVNGFVEAFRVGTWERTHSYNLNKCYKENEALGWCRGLAMDKNGMFVGFTRFRPSKSTDYTRWIRRKPSELPTRVIRYSFASSSIVDEFVLKSKPGSTILLYGIYPLDDNKQIPREQSY